jgi:adenylate cyclase
MLAAPGELHTSAGIHTGELILGVVSAGGKLEYTALGDAVNVAARLEQLNRETGTRVLISEAARAEAGLTARPAGCFLVKGRRAPVDACTLEEG